ncbi:photosynthetic complex putative assembly protein PuhB [Oceaniglobus roseus]|uniref:photosynthetic complex putative assembly protein PuhB n=1 Tax=Oceaniglobus roseus TaxID=1737570 RepID=UPI000C7F5201|nr:photosynthetic complex putative assembly protein PuhB [Kandeliimicrobium roseum]
MSHDDFAIEPVPGLPETLPKGELILWQGRPSVLGLACQALKVHWVALYFAVLAVWRVGVSSTELGFAAALPLAIPFLAVGLVACAILLLIAFCQARATLYTITTARVAMRIGAALTLTLNLPFNRIAGAALSVRKDGSGTIAIETAGEVRLSHMMLWPHVRPWHLKHTQPALRAIPDAARVARILADAAETRISRPEVSRRVDTSGAVAAE